MIASFCGALKTHLRFSSIGKTTDLVGTMAQ